MAAADAEHRQGERNCTAHDDVGFIGRHCSRGRPCFITP